MSKVTKPMETSAFVETPGESIEMLIFVQGAAAPLPVYTGPEQFLELRVPDDDGGSRIVPLACMPGQPLDIPADHPIALTFEAAGFIRPATDPAPATAAPASTE